MKTIRVKDSGDDYPVDDIVTALARQGLYCSTDQARRLWQRYSDSMCAGWMLIPDDAEEIYACVSPYISVTA